MYLFTFCRAYFTLEDNPNFFQGLFAIAFYQKACGLSQLRQRISQTVVSQVHIDVPIWLFVTTGSLSCCHMTCIYALLLSILVSVHPNIIRWHVCMSYCFPWLLDGSHTTSNDNFDEDDLEDKHLLPTSSAGEDAIVKEVHRWMSAGTLQWVLYSEM
jgi:hypothetical protein